MEVNSYSFDLMDVDARLPPRKRLLAGLKKQSCENAAATSSSMSSLSLSLSSFSSDFSAHLCELSGADFKSSHISPEQIVEASRLVALTAAEAAASARVTAMEKAAVAVKAVAAAKSALELVTLLTKRKTHKENVMRKNKLKKQVPIRLLYPGQLLIENDGSDEELACRLHQDMNSSPRISRNSSNPNRKLHSRKKRKELLLIGKPSLYNEDAVCEGNPPSICDRDGEVGDVDCVGSTLEVENLDNLEDKALLCAKTNCVDEDKIWDEEGETNNSIKTCGHAFEARVASGGKRERNKKKKLPLSLCNIRDHEKLKDKQEFIGFPSTEDPEVNYSLRTMPSYASKLSNEAEVAVDAIPISACKEFKVPQRFSASKILCPPCSNPTVTTVSAMVKVDQ
ncbi:uncharacterized protein LOC131237002 isoform X2 [Magnolia sinica]|uniref:uncharacterized protein LOC131237002 isoform X2 n=1 Tax=Magnolia sinica TaxID=86752 RepID=UPI00265ABF8A|nr:uncharacterized protein LOC131237002 isoform X2 [Magnolia sinica]